MNDVRTKVKQVLSAFNFGTDMCGVMRTVLVDPARSGPFQVRPPPHPPPQCRSLLNLFSQASMNRINSSCRRGYVVMSNMEVGPPPPPPPP